MAQAVPSYLIITFQHHISANIAYLANYGATLAIF